MMKTPRQLKWPVVEMVCVNFGTSICRSIKLQIGSLSILCLVFGKHGDTTRKFWRSTYHLGIISGEKIKGAFPHLDYSFLVFLGRILVW